MNNKQLQEAIDKTRTFVATSADNMQSMLDAKKESVKHLEALELLQRTRAEMAPPTEKQWTYYDPT